MATRIGAIAPFSLALILYMGLERSTATAQNIVPQWRISQLFQFDGISDHVRITDRSQFRVESLTLAVWVRTEDISLQQPVIAKALGKGNWVSYMLRLQENGRVSFNVDNENNVSAHWLSRKALQAKQWHHLAATWKNRKGDARDATIYLDGEPLEIDMIRSAGYGPDFRIGYSAEPLFIGRDEFPSGHFKGSIKEVTIIGRALDAGEIAKLAAVRKASEPGHQEVKDQTSRPHWPRASSSCTRSRWNDWNPAPRSTCATRRTASRMCLPK